MADAFLMGHGGSGVNIKKWELKEQVACNFGLPTTLQLNLNDTFLIVAMSGSHNKVNGSYRDKGSKEWAILVHKGEIIFASESNHVMTYNDIHGEWRYTNTCADVSDAASIDSTGKFTITMNNANYYGDLGVNSYTVWKLN